LKLSVKIEIGTTIKKTGTEFFLKEKLELNRNQPLEIKKNQNQQLFLELKYRSTLIKPQMDISKNLTKANSSFLFLITHAEQKSMCRLDIIRFWYGQC
jgi:hypothetical protein